MNQRNENEINIVRIADILILYGTKDFQKSCDTRIKKKKKKKRTNMGIIRVLKLNSIEIFVFIYSV